MTQDFPIISSTFGATFSKSVFSHREGSVTLHPVSWQVGCVRKISLEANKAGFKLREGSVTHHSVVNKHREANKVFLEFKEPFSSEKGSLPPEALVGKGE
ncbi:MAG: hypothetical protein MSR67_08630 [Oscillospiraceae bacterium]|nr:hypothetical protein [Oscillospiraceae bacterium]